MRYTTFGRSTGLRVSEYALGTANFGTGWGGGADREESLKIFDRFAEAGGTFLDTADIYSNGDSERMLAEFIAADRGHFVLATKYGLSAGDRRISTTGNNRKNMVQSVEASLSRLRTDYLDLLWVHWPDPLTPTQEILAALNDLVRAGKVMHIGFSNFPAWQVAHGAAVADLRGWAPVVGVQFEYSLVERTADRDLLPMADALGLGVNFWSPLGGGLLTGKYRRDTSGRLQDWNGEVLQRENTKQKTAVLDTVQDIAEQTGTSPAQVSVAWLLHLNHSHAGVRVPIIGPRREAHLAAYLDALNLTLSPEQFERLNRISAPTLGVPHDGAAGTVSAMVGGDSSIVALPLIPVA